MENSHVTFQHIGKADILPVVYKKITSHIICDIKMDCTSKYRYVAGVNMFKHFRLIQCDHCITFC